MSVTSDYFFASVETVSVFCFVHSSQALVSVPSLQYSHAFASVVTNWVLDESLSHFPQHSFAAVVSVFAHSPQHSVFAAVNDAVAASSLSQQLPQHASVPESAGVEVETDSSTSTFAPPQPAIADAKTIKSASDRLRNKRVCIDNSKGSLLKTIKWWAIRPVLIVAKIALHPIRTPSNLSSGSRELVRIARVCSVSGVPCGESKVNNKSFHKPRSRLMKMLFDAGHLRVPGIK